ncbi:ATP-binding cassette domain-containing protein [Oribacterium sp. oral taxon 102]|uniref:methionine ABC transporter ATP-binding protein n=1 Tax=Oribacterium sp. oral taxon 102 TaxID=671214 RepID=UPI0015BD3C6A|nr:ATP-binding cassette domain-containing protein [Oribacterium sp. oral taxon 102]NWO21318.1 ATP-binding cassette domain-containing protein [Oribacterium sp. oral taxon 102]
MADYIIELKNIGKTFHTSSGDVTALDDISLGIRRGTIQGIIGLSGAGKSTLVRCINYLEIPTSGQVLFEGRSLGDMNAKQVRETRREMGMIFQQFNLLEQRTLLHNVTFPLEIAGKNKKEARERALELLKLVGLEDRVRNYPSQLSGGQKQRVAIARALATNPKVLLCDEATSALDPKTTKQILELLKRINKELGVTVIIITHQMSVVEAICDEVAIIDRSQIAEAGAVSEVFHNPRSEIGRKLILGEENSSVSFDGSGRKLRIVFDGRKASEPILADMILSCRTTVNILFANTRQVGEEAVGQMVVELSEKEDEAGRVLDYLRSRGIRFEEVR